MKPGPVLLWIAATAVMFYLAYVLVRAAGTSDTLLQLAGLAFAGLGGYTLCIGVTEFRRVSRES